MTNTSSSGEMVYVEHKKDINGFHKVILREVRGCSAEVRCDLRSFSSVNLSLWLFVTVESINALWIFVYSMIFDEFSPNFCQIVNRNFGWLMQWSHNSRRWENLANLETKSLCFCKKTKRLGCKLLLSWFLDYIFD